MYWLTLYFSVIYAYSDIKEDKPYQLLCPDGTPGIDKILHICCGEKEPYLFCALCARMNIGHIEGCASLCNGTVEMREQGPYCVDCVCHPPKPRPVIEDEEEEGGRTRFHGCPYMSKRGKKEL